MNAPVDRTAQHEESPQLTIVLPAYGEADNLRSLLPRLLAQATGTRVQIVVVDDHSRDKTFEVVREWAAKDPRIEGIRLARNSGSHLAILCGLQAARGAAAVVLAADGQDPPEFIAQLVAAWRDGAQVVWAVRGSREEEATSTVFFSRAYYWLMNTIGDVRLPPAGADFFLIDRRVVKAVLAIPEYRISLFALIASLGFRQVEIPYAKRPRTSGASKWTLRKKVRLLVDSLTGFSTVPLRLATVLGFAYAGGGFIYAVLLVVNKLSSGQVFGGVPVNGFAALMTVLLISSGCIMIILGIFGEYLSRALEQVRGRPRFLIEDSTDLIGRPTA